MSLALSPVDARKATGGVQIKNMDDDELAVYIQQAQDLCADYINVDTLEYHQVVSELHNWNASSLNFHLYEGPIRIIQSYTLMLGAWGGKDISFDITDTPVGITGSPSILPTNFGGIKVNRSTNSGDASSFIMSAGLYVPYSQFSTVEQEFTYTAGYDDGNPQADGFTLPWPSWFKTALRYVVNDLLGDWQVGRKGMQGLQELKVADTVFRRPQQRPMRGSEPIVIPLSARRILDRHFSPWVG